MSRLAERDSNKYYDCWSRKDGIRKRRAMLSEEEEELLLSDYPIQSFPLSVAPRR